MFANNAPAKEHSEERLNEIDTLLVCINTKDEIQQGVKLTQMLLDAINERKK